MKQLLLFSLLLVLLTNCKTTHHGLRSTNTYRVAFYNVENLFDTFDDPLKIDEEFTPEGRNKWTIARYQQKIEQLNEVFAGMGYPALIGLAEVENGKVLADLCQILTKNSGRNYAFRHEDSPDKRGIDCAFVYQTAVFDPSGKDIIRIPFPEAISGESDYTSRDILYVKGVLANSDTLHFFVNHWPSRRGGLSKSKPRRMHVARYLRRYTDSLFQDKPRANILLMGDFNDEPNNESITRMLDTRSAEPTFYNLMDSLDQLGRGSYNYRGNWNMLDQILVSPNLKQGKDLTAGNAYLFDPDWLCFQHPRFGRTPNRTYGGPNYYGGYSDHFPVYFDLQSNRNKKAGKGY